MIRRPLLALLLAAASCAPGPASDAAADLEALEAEVRDVSLALVAAQNAHDADAVLAFYDLSDDFVQVSCTDYVFGGRSFGGITRSLHHLYENGVYEMRVRAVRVLGPDVAVVSLQGTFFTPLFVTRVLTRGAQGAWLVTWEHESWPGCEGPQAPHPGTVPEAEPSESGR